MTSAGAESPQSWTTRQVIDFRYRVSGIAAVGSGDPVAWPPTSMICAKPVQVARPACWIAPPDRPVARWCEHEQDTRMPSRGSSCIASWFSLRYAAVTLGKVLAPLDERRRIDDHGTSNFSPASRSAASASKASSRIVRTAEAVRLRRLRQQLQRRSGRIDRTRLAGARLRRREPPGADVAEDVEHADAPAPYLRKAWRLADWS